MVAWRVALQSHCGRQGLLWQQIFWTQGGKLGGNMGLNSLVVHRGRPGTSNWRVAKLCNPLVRGGHQCSVTAETVTQLFHQGHFSEAVEALGVLVQKDCRIARSLLYTVLRKFMFQRGVGQGMLQRGLVLGRRVHALVVQKGSESDTFLCNQILRMYASHGRLQEAMDVFSVVAAPDAFVWSTIISAHVNHGQAGHAVQLYHQMRRSRVKPDGHVFVAALQACARGADLKAGQVVHADVLAAGAELDLFVCNCLVDMYAKCGSLEDAQKVFDGLGQKDVVTWTALIAGYSQQGMGQEALDVYSAMEEEGVAAPNAMTFASLLQACASVGPCALEKGKQLHAQIRKRGLEADMFVDNGLVNMYAKCGSLEDAQAVFDRLRQKDVVTWTALIAGYAQKGMSQEALHLYTAMQQEAVAVPNAVTFASLLQACASVGALALETGKQLHAQIDERGLKNDVIDCSLVNMYVKCGSMVNAQGVFDDLDRKDVVTCTNLIAGYAKCGSLEEARRLFDGLPQKDVVAWNAMIAGYSRKGMAQEALRLYTAMQDEGIAVTCAPNAVTFVALLQACAGGGPLDLEKGKQLHGAIKEQGLEADVFVANSVVDMYVRCGSLEEAQNIFDGLPQKDVVTWNAMISGYVQKGMGQEALRLYGAMQAECIVAPDTVTFVCLLQACASVGAMHLGRQLHANIEEHGLGGDVLVAVSLIDMYAKSGSMVHAQQVFEALPERDVVAWNALIAGYTRQGDSDVVFDLLLRMEEEGIQPSGVTFLGVLTVCSHTGLVREGREYFDAMSKYYGMIPSVEHFTCMVDLLGRAGQLEEALALVRTMPVQRDAAVWHALLGACQKWSDVELGRHAFIEAVKLDKTNSAPYVLMSNICSSANLWEQAEQMQAKRTGTRAWKQPGQSWWTDMDGLVHSFLVGEKSCLERDKNAAFFQEGNASGVAAALCAIASGLVVGECIR